MTRSLPITGRKNRKTVVPLHGNEELGIGLLKEIMKQADISRESYDNLRQKV